MDFMCPHCRKPLYDARSFISVNGRCPHCKEGVVS
jgi:phage FluMu protein Com